MIYYIGSGQRRRNGSSHSFHPFRGLRKPDVSEINDRINKQVNMQIKFSEKTRSFKLDTAGATYLMQIGTS